MLGNIFKKFFETKNDEQLKMEKELKSLTVNDVVHNFEIKNKMENTNKMEKEVLAENIEQPTDEIVEDAQETVSEETEAVEEQPKTDEGDIEPSQEPAVETENVEEQQNEEKEEGQEEPQDEQAEESVEEKEVCPKCGKEECECEQQEQSEEPQQEELQPEKPEEVPQAEDEQPAVEEQPTDKVVVTEDKVELPENIVKPSEVVVEVEDKTSALLKEIDQLKAENLKQEVTMKKMNLAKEVEQNYAGVPAKTEDKVEFIYEIQQSALSDETKKFILDSLHSLSAQNLKDCQEIGHSQEVEVDKEAENKSKVQKAMQEHDLTESQAFLFVNGDRTLAEAKKVSDRVRSKRK